MHDGMAEPDNLVRNRISRHEGLSLLKKLEDEKKSITAIYVSKDEQTLAGFFGVSITTLESESFQLSHSPSNNRTFLRVPIDGCSFSYGENRHLSEQEIEAVLGDLLRGDHFIQVDLADGSRLILYFDF